MIYTLLIGLLCLLVSLYCLKFYYNNMNNVTLLKKISCKTPNLYNSKEYLFTKLKSLIPANTNDLNEEKIKAIFSDSAIKNITDNGDNAGKNCYLKYDRINNCIIMFSYVDEYFHREDAYECKVTTSNIKFVYKYTIFKGGRSKPC